MTEARDLSFFARLWMAFVCFWQILLKPPFAQAVLPSYDALREGRPLLPADTTAKKPDTTPEPVVVQKPVEIAKDAPRAVDHSSGLLILSMLQREGRFIDFLQEEVASFSDQEVGGAARVVHEGCRKVLRQYLTLEPVLKEGEGARVNVPAGFDANRIRLTGNVAGSPPFSGTLKHHGWIATDVKLPQVSPGIDHKVLAAAEVEL